MAERIKARKPLLRRLVIVCYVIVILIITNTNLIPFANNTKFIYFGKPLLWLGVAWLVYQFPRGRKAGRMSLQRFINHLAVGSAVVYLLFMMVGGMITGFGRSPYSFGLVTSSINFLYIFSLTVGVEAARAYLLNSYKGKRVFFLIGLVSLFFVFTEISFRELRNLTTIFAAVRYFGSTFCPAFAVNIFTSYLAYLGGFVPAAIFHGLLLAFEWFCPILPDLSWTMKTFLGCFIPAFTLLFVRNLYYLQARLLKRTTTESEELFGWLVTSVIAVAIIWFAVGLFPLYPSVIVTGSMEPVIKPGDIVLVKKIAGEEAMVGDVLQFYEPEEKLNITHRVMAINQEGTKLLETKGDNNEFPDSDPVTMEQVKGKVIGIIPKVGWFTLLLRSNDRIPSEIVSQGEI